MKSIRLHLLLFSCSEKVQSGRGQPHPRPARMKCNRFVVGHGAAMMQTGHIHYPNEPAIRHLVLKSLVMGRIYQQLPSKSKHFAWAISQDPIASRRAARPDVRARRKSDDDKRWKTLNTRIYIYKLHYRRKWCARIWLRPLTIKAYESYRGKQISLRKLLPIEKWSFFFTLFLHISRCAISPFCNWICIVSLHNFRSREEKLTFYSITAEKKFNTFRFSPQWRQNGIKLILFLTIDRLAKPLRNEIHGPDEKLRSFSFPSCHHAHRNIHNAIEA